MYGVIDIGSNSIRLMISDGEVALKKYLVVANLAQNIASTGRLSQDAMTRAKEALQHLQGIATDHNVAQLYIFATEAVRSATNGGEFVEMIRQQLHLHIDVIAGEQESEIGFMGAYTGGGCCGILDIGGASTEIAIGDESGIWQKASAKIGSVRLLELAKEDRAAAEKIITQRFGVFQGGMACDKLIGIGGTATTLAAIALELEPYDSSAVDGYVLTRVQLEQIIARIQPMTIPQRHSVKGLMQERAEVIVSGAYIMVAAMELCKKECITVSERDNLEGYLMLKLSSTI